MTSAKILPAPDEDDVCDDCGGDLRVADWPKSVAGCSCEARRVTRAQRSYVDAAAGKGTLSAEEYAAYLSAGGHYPPPEGA